MPNTVTGLPFGGQTPQQPSPYASIAQYLLRQGVNQGLRYGINQTGIPNYLTNAISGLFGGGAPAAGTMAASLGLPSATAGIASEGGGFGADVLAGLAGGAGFGTLGAFLAPVMLIAGLGGAFQGTPNSLFGYRPAGYSKAHAQARTAQQNQSMALSNAVINAAQNLPASGSPAPPGMLNFLQQVAIPKSGINMGLFRALDEGATENRGGWPTQSNQTAEGLLALYNTYGNQLDPATQVGLIQAMRLPAGVQRPSLPQLTPDQYKGLNYETQAFYNQLMPNDPQVQAYQNYIAQHAADQQREAQLLTGSGGGANY